MKFIALIAVLFAFASSQAIADEASTTTDQLDKLEQFAEKVDAVDRGEATVYELAASSNEKAGS